MVDMSQAVNLTVNAVYKWREDNAEDGRRAHLGASLIGHHCERYLWLAFHWCKTEKFSGRTLRIFDTGKREEMRIIEELRGIGAKVTAEENGQQLCVSALGGHFGGSLDGVAEGLPEAPKTPHVLEFKTHNAKSFVELQKKGVREAKPQHYAQMQVYMALTGLTRAAYIAINKDDDSIYFERIEENKDVQKKLIERAQRILEAKEPAQKISEDPTWYQCKFCPMHSLCHGHDAPDVNCRTCAHSTPELSGGWHCAAHNKGGIPDHVQRQGCERHLHQPSLIARFAEPLDSSASCEPTEAGAWVKYRNKITGHEFTNGLARVGHTASADVHKHSGMPPMEL